MTNATTIQLVISTPALTQYKTGVSGGLYNIKVKHCWISCSDPAVVIEFRSSKLHKGSASNYFCSMNILTSVYYNGSVEFKGVSLNDVIDIALYDKQAGTVIPADNTFHACILDLELTPVTN
jgi:hypothetical protein